MLLFSQQVLSDSLQPHGLQHSRLLYPSLSPGLCPNSCPLSWWCYRTILYSVTPCSSCPQSFLASGSFPMSWLFASDGQSNTKKKKKLLVIPQEILTKDMYVYCRRSYSSWWKRSLEKQFCIVLRWFFLSIDELKEGTQWFKEKIIRY